MDIITFHLFGWLYTSCEKQEAPCYSFLVFSVLGDVKKMVSAQLKNENFPKVVDHLFSEIVK